MIRYRQLAAALGQSRTVLDLWTAAFARSTTALPGTLRTPNELWPLLQGIVSELAHALPRERDDGVVLHGDLIPGSPSTRELEKATAFMGASVAGLGGSGFDLAAGLLALRDVACAVDPDEDEAIRGMFEWLLVIAMDAFASAGIAAVQEHHAAYLAQKTPLVMVSPMLPALLLVGAPDRLSLDSIFSRLLFSVIRVGASFVIVDATGLVDAGAEHVLQCLSGFVHHQNIAGKLDILALGLSRAQERAWARVCITAHVGLEHYEHFYLAVARAQ